MTILDEMSFLCTVGCDLFITLIEERPEIAIQLLRIKGAVLASSNNSLEQKKAVEAWFKMIAHRQIALNQKATEQAKRGLTTEQKQKNETSLDLN